MHESNVSKRYATAIIGLAVEQDQVDPIGADLNKFESLLHAHGAMLHKALQNPSLTTEERHGILGALLPRLGLSELATNLLKLMTDKGRLHLAGDVARVYQKMADERAGRTAVHVRTAEPMSPQIEAEVRMALEQATGKTVVLQTSVDRALIGGMVATVGGKVYDSSIRTRLENMARELISAPAEA
jgi:F-type H+-transporting ATPase subunit delta